LQDEVVSKQAGVFAGNEKSQRKPNWFTLACSLLLAG
jgi:hypothetical protein